jgi:hypothetical protein
MYTRMHSRYSVGAQLPKCAAPKQGRMGRHHMPVVAAELDAPPKQEADTKPAEQAGLAAKPALRGGPSRAQPSQKAMEARFAAARLAGGARERALQTPRWSSESSETPGPASGSASKEGLKAASAPPQPPRPQPQLGPPPSLTGPPRLAKKEPTRPGGNPKVAGPTDSEYRLTSRRRQEGTDAPGPRPSGPPGPPRSAAPGPNLGPNARAGGFRGRERGPAGK